MAVQCRHVVTVKQSFKQMQHLYCFLFLLINFNIFNCYNLLKNGHKNSYLYEIILLNHLL